MTTDGEKAEGEIVVDETLDGPGSFFYPFSNLRLAAVPAELRITHGLRDEIATAAEDPTLSAHGKASVWAGLCLAAIGELESELVALSRELRGGQEN
jgi:hypothetical protein